MVRAPRATPDKTHILHVQSFVKEFAHGASAQPLG